MNELWYNNNIVLYIWVFMKKLNLDLDFGIVDYKIVGKEFFMIGCFEN